MNNFILSAGLIGSILLGSASGAMAEERQFQKDELQIELREVTSLIRSSKKQYHDWFLYVGVVKSAKIAQSDHALSDDLVQLIAEGKTVEIMVHKSNCYEEIVAAFVQGQATVKLDYLKNLYFTATPDSDHHDFFMKVEPIQTEERNRIECIVSR